MQEALCARIDDAGLAQHGELVWRIRQRFTTGGKRMRECRAQIIDTLIAGLPQRSSKHADD